MRLGTPTVAIRIRAPAPVVGERIVFEFPTPLRSGDIRLNVTDATNATPIVVTTVAPHDLENGETVTISGVTGNTAANGTFTVANKTATTFELAGSSGNGAYAGGGVVLLPQPVKGGKKFTIKASTGTPGKWFFTVNGFYTFMRPRQAKTDSV
jgi:hypothetical protein